MTVRDMARPTGGQLAVAGFLGIVFGALGAGFALVLGLFLLVMITVGVWRAVTLLTVIANRPARPGAPVDRTVPIRSAGGRR